MHSDLLLALVVLAAVVFDFTNGFHDTANVVASAISTRALSPRSAVALASVLNYTSSWLKYTFDGMPEYTYDDFRHGRGVPHVAYVDCTLQKWRRWYLDRRRQPLEALPRFRR